jgi:hypothetical protein
MSTTFGPALKCMQSGKKPPAEQQSIFEKWRHKFLRQLWRAREYANAKQVNDKNGVPQLRQPIRASPNGFIDVQPSGHDQNARAMVCRRQRSQVALQRLLAILVRHSYSRHSFHSSIAWSP